MLITWENTRRGKGTLELNFLLSFLKLRRQLSHLKKGELCGKRAINSFNSLLIRCDGSLPGVEPAEGNRGPGTWISQALLSRGWAQLPSCGRCQGKQMGDSGTASWSLPTRGISQSQVPTSSQGPPSPELDAYAHPPPRRSRSLSMPGPGEGGVRAGGVGLAPHGQGWASYK